MQAIGSLAFQNESYYQQIINLVNNSTFKNCKSEEDIRKKFENETNRILHVINALPIDKYIEFDSEVGIDGGRRIDSQYRNIIIEYKKYKRLSNKKDHDNAIVQLTDYMNDSKFINQSVYGILFDGEIMEIYYKNEKNEIGTPNKSINGPLSAQNLDFYFKTAFLKDKKELNSFSLKRDFNIESKLVNPIYKHFYKMLLQSTSKRTALMHNEWKKMFKLSEADSSEGHALHQDILERRNALSNLTGTIIDNTEKEYFAIFALHTLFSIILKILLLKTVNEFKKVMFDSTLEDLCSYKNNELHNFFDELESGVLLKRAGLINMIEGDFFSWYVKENDAWNDELTNNLKKLISAISLYEDARLKTYTTLEDLFRELYEAFIPGIVRHCFGEYYTPYWLAQSVIQDATNQELTSFKTSTLDPCCGSGTFLINALNERINLLKAENQLSLKCTTVQANILFNGIVGIDLNPLAVLMARTNLLINAIPYINNKYDIIEIPVYNGDSTYSPTISYLDGIKMLNYSLATTVKNAPMLEISIPYDFVASQEFTNILDKVEKYIVTLDTEGAFYAFINPMKKIIGDLPSSVSMLIARQIDQLIDLEKNELNGIWLRIFGNYLKTGVLGKFERIVGNPPWVKWSVLPENYRNTVKNKCRLDGLFSNDKNVGGNDLNISALIANKCAEKWLDKNGTLSFLMPQSILFNKSFEGFRNLIVYEDSKKEHCYFQSIRDWTKAGDPFKPVTEKFCTFTIGFKEQDYLKGIPYFQMKKHKKTDYKINDDWEYVEKQFDCIEKKAYIFKNKENNNFSIAGASSLQDEYSKIVGEQYYNFRSGCDVMYPMQLTFKKQIDDKHSEFYLWTKKGDRKVQSEETRIFENEFIRPLITSPMVKKNYVDWKDTYVIAAYDNTKKPVGWEELQIRAPKIAEYLLQNKPILVNRSSYNKRVQNNQEFYALLRMGNYSFFEEYVLKRDNVCLVGATISKIKTHWGDCKIPLFECHINYCGESSKGSLEGISKEEAQYIANILNVDTCREFVESSTDDRSIPGRLPIKIPKFDPKNALQQKIAACTDDALIKEMYFELIKE